MPKLRSLLPQEANGLFRQIQWLKQSIEEWGEEIANKAGLQNVENHIRAACHQSNEKNFQAAAQILCGLAREHPNLRASSSERKITLHKGKTWFEIRRSNVNRIAHCAKVWTA